MFKGASTFADGVDQVFLLIFIFSVIALTGITLFMLYCLVRFSKKRNPVPTHIEGHIGLETLWIVIPTILVTGMFYIGWKNYLPMLASSIPKDQDALEVLVTGRTWSWTFTYANVDKNGKEFTKVSKVLKVPVDRPILLKLKSVDVLHSFYIPAFRAKQDVVPNVDNRMWFQATRKGSFDVFCTEYCGEQHSYMLTQVEVMNKDDFQTWYDTIDLPDGKTIINVKGGCFVCHGQDGIGDGSQAPSLKGLFGSTRTVIQNGQEVEIEADEEYLKKSILQPQADLVKGYEKASAMPGNYKDELSEEDIQAIIVYLKKLK